MSSLTLENLPHLCRACLRNLVKNKNLPILNEKQKQPAFYSIDRTQDLSKWMAIINPLEDVTRLTNIVQHQRYPEYVCRSCYENFKHVNDFKEMVVHSFSVLNKLLTGANETKRPTEITETVTQGELLIKSEPIDDYNDGDSGDDGEDQDDKYSESGWDLQDAVLSNNNDMKCGKNIKLEPIEFVDPVTAASSSSSPPLEGEGQPKATKAYKCPVCKNSYVHRYTYVAHIRQMHLGIEHAFECDICHKRYTKFCNLYRHMRKDHNQSLRQYKCEYSNCNRSFRQLTTRRKHYEKFHKHERLPDHVERVSHECLKHEEEQQVLQHSSIETPFLSSTATSPDTGIQPITSPSSFMGKRSYICPICACCFETSYDLKVHMDNDHKDQFKFRCHICGKKKISQLKLDEHITAVHDNPRETCNICKKVLKSKSHVRQHILSVHNGVKPFHCEYCPATFAAKNTLKVHTRLHTGEKPFKCYICDRRFTQLTPMKKHLITHEKGHRNAIE